MRYIANDDGYLLEVSFGAEIYCNGRGCTEYTGAVPEGYDSLADWFTQECDKFYRWHIVAGNLTKDNNAASPENLPNFKIYQSLAALGLSDYNVTTKQVFKAMPLFSKLIIQTSYSSTAAARTITDLPENYCVVELTRLNSYCCGFATRVNTMTTQYFECACHATSSAGDEGFTGWNEKLTDRTGVSLTKLWQNASPTSNFAAQTVSLDLSKYQMVAIAYRFNTSDDYRKMYFGTVGSTMALDVISTSGYLGWRSATVSTTGISFSTATYNGNSGVVGYIIPVAIYGSRGVI